MMVAQDRLDTVLQVAGRNEEAAARALAQTGGHVSAQRAKLAELERFRSDYTQTFAESGEAGLSGHMLATRWRFIRHINDAIDHETTKLDQLLAEFAARQQQWSNARTRAEALRKLRGRAVAQRLRVDARREQTMSDEASRTPGRVRGLTI
jgi:flagellar protein FliJ